MECFQFIFARNKITILYLIGIEQQIKGFFKLCQLNLQRQTTLLNLLVATEDGKQSLPVLYYQMRVNIYICYIKTHGLFNMLMLVEKFLHKCKQSRRLVIEVPAYFY